MTGIRNPRPTYLGDGAALAAARGPSVPPGLVDSVLRGETTMIEAARQIFEIWKAAEAARTGPDADFRLNNPVIVCIATMGLLMEKARAYAEAQKIDFKITISYQRPGQKWGVWDIISVTDSNRLYPHEQMMDLANRNIDFNWRATITSTPIVIAET